MRSAGNVARASCSAIAGSLSPVSPAASMSASSSRSTVSSCAVSASAIAWSGSETQNASLDWLLAGETTSTSAPSTSWPSVARSRSASTGSGVSTRSFIAGIGTRTQSGTVPLRGSAEVVVGDRGAAPGAAEDGLEREHVARPVEVGRVEVEPQQAPGGERARPHRERRAAQGEGRRERGVLTADEPQQRRPPVEVGAQVVPERGRVGVGGGDEAARLHAGQGEHPAAGHDARPRRLRVEPGELRLVAAPPADGPGAAVLEAVLRDGVAAVAAVEQPGGEVGAALEERVQVGSGDDEQRGALDPVVGEPVADQRAALERGRLDVVDGDGDPPLPTPRRAGRGHATSRSACEPSVASARRQPAARRPRDASQVRSRTAARPPRARRSRIAREPASPATAPASASGRGAQSRPLRPSAISSAGPPAAAATTGRPEACASSTTWPNVSVCEQKRKRSADA